MPLGQLVRGLRDYISYAQSTYGGAACEWTYALGGAACEWTPRAYNNSNLLGTDRVSKNSHLLCTTVAYNNSIPLLLPQLVLQLLLLHRLFYLY